jgi:NADP-dependent 3-hydroxy acid dehydrogenase YdfG
MQMQNLTGKVAVITGASSGIGEAASRLLVDEGVHVILAARRKERIDALAEELGQKATAIQSDVSNLEQVRNLFAQVKEQFGGLDLLFNNAGLAIFGLFADSDPEDWRTMIDVNLFGLLSCTQAAIPLMKGRTGAMISSVSSTAGRYGFVNWSIYSATKFAVVGFHDALRKELGADGIRVSVIEPGATWSELGHKAPDGLMREYRESIDAMKPNDVAQALVYSFAQPPNVLVEEILVRPVKQTTP